jgi:hypothetical protein
MAWTKGLLIYRERARCVLAVATVNRDLENLKAELGWNSMSETD